MIQTAGSEESDEFGKFLFSEYSNIAEAHFRTTEAISAFIKYYLTIISAPIAILGVAVSYFTGSGQIADYNVLLSVAPIVAFLFVVISFVGLMVLPYIINLRMDALLYARTVNGIRKYFYDREDGLDIAAKSRLSVLPQSPLLPAYREPFFFGPIVLILALLNTVYFYPGSAVIAYALAAESFTHPIVLVLTSLFFTAHVGCYLFLTHYREHAYLRSNILGVDIDGVINLHRAQFCRSLVAKVRKRIDEEEITAIPVHDCPHLGVTREDEMLVFNDPTYWIKMPPMKGAASALQRLRNSLRVKVHIFTHRPWPVTVDLPREDKRQVSHTWASASRAYVRRVRKNTPWWRRFLSSLRSVGRTLPYRVLRLRELFRRDEYIDRITRAWLEEHGFEYDRIMIERGSEEAACPSSHIVNRFYACRRGSIRFFVEDDPIKASRLAFICDVVFLMDHPYNRTDKLPANVIRVHSWKEILRHMREIW